MQKEKVLRYSDLCSEFSLYLIIIAIPFSNAIMYIALTLFIASWLLKNILLNSFRLPVTGANLVMILFLAWNLFTFFHSQFRLESLKGVFKVLRYLVLLWAVFDVITTLKIFKRVTLVLLFSSLIIAFDGIFQYYFGFDVIRFKTLDVKDILHRIQASFRHSNDFGAYLVFIIPIVISLFLSPVLKRMKRAVFFIPMLLFLFCLIKTQSRGAWLAFLAAILFLGMLKGKKTFFLISMFLLLFLLIAPHGFKDRLTALFRIERNTVWERVKLWEGTVNMIKAHPVQGFGVNTFSKYFPEYKPADYPDLRYSHNCYLQMASEIGIVGLLLFLLSLILLFRNGFRVLSKVKGSFEKAILMGVMSGLLGFVIHSGLDTHLYSAPLQTLFWFGWGFLCSGKD